MTSSPSLAGLLLVCALLLVPALGLAAQPLWRAARRERQRRRPFPAPWRELLRRGVPLVAHLPADLQLRLKRHMQVFLAEKPIIGCGGLQVDDAMRVAIAAQACLLLLGQRRPDYFPLLRQVLVYPAAFVVERARIDGSGVLHERRQALAGESWAQGQVLLSWADCQTGAAQPHDGRNLVIHEFAHQLDQLNGPANGAPWLPGRARRAHWAQVLADAFAQCQAGVARGEPGLLDPYAATDPAEFFAVASEVFFEQGPQLAAQHPALYAQLRTLYQVDPLCW